ncbi:glycosyltransferase family 4 protein [Elusimicrobiota bacterium]
MRICLVSLQYGITATGGGGVHVNRIADEYIRRDHEVTVITMHTSRTEADASITEADGVRYSHDVNGDINVIRILVDEGLATPYDGDTKEEEYSRLKRFADFAEKLIIRDSESYDIVHNHGHHILPGYLAYKLKDNPLKIVSTIHFLESTLRGKEGVDHINEMPEQLYGDLVSWEVMTSFADEVVVISPGQQEDFLKMLSGAETPARKENIDDRIHLISSGVEDGSILSAEEILDKWSDKERKLNVLTYSRMDPSKGLHYAVRALPQLAAAYPPGVSMTAAGIPAKGYDKVLKDEKEKIGPDYDCKLAFFDRIATIDERNSFMDKFDIYMFPTLSEPFGITLIETAARGMLVLTTDSAGPYYILAHDGAEEKSWGYITPYGINVKLTDDPEDNLVNNLVEAWKWSCDNTDAVKEMILHFRELILQKYTWSSVVSQYLEMYK